MPEHERGILRFQSAEDASSAIQALNGTDCNGQQLLVKEDDGGRSKRRNDYYGGGGGGGYYAWWLQ